MNITIIGAGSWGTALAINFARLNHSIKLWVHGKDTYEILKETRENKIYLPSFKLQDNIHLENDITDSIKNSELIIISVPSKYFRNVIKEIKKDIPSNAFILSATKGIEADGYKRMSEVIKEELEIAHERIGVLSGPSFAQEVALGYPTAIVIASENLNIAAFLQKELSSNSLRIYRNDDITGVELGGSLKNIIAIAAGIITGIGFGNNTIAALITRGLAEMTRLAKSMNAKPETLFGLSGLGDLVLTCTSSLSRNKTLGIRLGKGEKLNNILKSMRMIAEGVYTTQAAINLKNKFKIEMPIVEQVYKILYEDKEPSQAIEELMQRSLKDEFYP